jgi:type I restriction enzyme, S subunit
MIPDGWQECELGQACEFQRGFDLPSSKRNPGSVPVISSSGVSGYHDVPMASPPGIVTGRYGTIGTLYYVEEPYWPLNTALWVKNLFGNNARFFYHLLSRFDFKKFSDKTGVPGVNRNDLHSVQILVPPLVEQRRIAEILSAWDRAIETTEQLIANSQAQKKALMQQLLTGKKRLPGFSGEWRSIKLGQAFSERDERNPGDMPLLSVSQAEGIIPQEDAGRRNISSSDTSNYKVVRYGDIAYNTMRMWQGASGVSALEGIVSPAYTIVVPRQRECSEYYGYLFKWPAMIHTFERHSQGLVSDTWNLKFPFFSKIGVLVPGLEEQRQIAKVLSAQDHELSRANDALRKLRSEKFALMQQLLTGKRRVKLPSTQEEAV